MPLVASGLPLSDQLNAECERTQRALEAAQKEVDRLSRAAPHANSVFKEKFNVTIIKLIDNPKYKTDKLREAQAQVDCAKEYLDYKLQEALLDAARSAVFTYKALLNAWQTKCGNLKAESDVAKVGAPGQTASWSQRQY